MKAVVRVERCRVAACLNHRNIDAPVERIGADVREAIGDEVDRVAPRDDDILDDGRRLSVANGPVTDDAQRAGNDATVHAVAIFAGVAERAAAR